MPVPSSASGATQVDIVATYRRILSSDPDIAMPAAAVEALAEALSLSTASTVFEIVDMLTAHTDTLKAAAKNPISLTAGCDIFLRYVTTKLTELGSQQHVPVHSPLRGSASAAAEDFGLIRRQLIEDTHNFVLAAKQCKQKIVYHGRKLFADGETTTVLTNGRSRVVATLLRSVAESSNVRLRVVYVMSSPSTDAEHAYEGEDIVADLRARGVPVATIPAEAVAYAFGHLRMVDMVLVGAEGVIYNGGIISRLGTYQMAILAKKAHKPFYVLAEMFKFVRLTPLGQSDLPVQQNILNFMTDGDTDERANLVAEDGDVGSEKAMIGTREDFGLVDLTHPQFIECIVTDEGYIDTHRVFPILQKIWT